MKRTILIHLNVEVEDDRVAEDIAHDLGTAIAECEETHDLDVTFALVREIRRRSPKIVVGERYMLRQGRAVPGERRVVSGEIVTVVAAGSERVNVRTHDGVLVPGVKKNELGRNK